MAKNKKLIKEQREKVLEIVKKWQKEKFHYSVEVRDGISRNALVGFAGGATAASMIADLFLTGGMVTICSMGFGVLSGGYLISVACYEGKNGNTEWENKAGQIILSDPLVRLALKGMQVKLSDKFNASSAAKGAEKIEKEFEFNEMAKDVRQDLEVLKSSYTITDGGVNGYGTDQFEFELSSVEIKKVVTKGPVTLGTVENDNAEQKKTTRHNRSFGL